MTLSRRLLMCFPMYLYGNWLEGLPKRWWIRLFEAFSDALVEPLDEAAPGLFVDSFA